MIKSTIVEILLSLQTGEKMSKCGNLQQQKFYLVFRPQLESDGVKYIYNSRNFTQSLDKSRTLHQARNLQQQKFYLVFRPLKATLRRCPSTIVEILLSLQTGGKEDKNESIYNSRNFTQSLDARRALFFERSIYNSRNFTQSLDRLVRLINHRNLQQQKFYLVFRQQGWLSNLDNIYNSRNFTQSLDNSVGGVKDYYLQQQKFYLVFRHQ